MKKNKKTIWNILFLILLCGATFWLMLKDQDLPAIIQCITEAKKSYLLIGIMLVVLFVCCESVIIHYMMQALHKKTRLYKCIKYSFIGFFFSCITPSATGGQPAQIYYMNKDGLDIPVSTLVLMIVTIGYKFVLVLIGFVLAVFYQDFIQNYLCETRFLFYLGLILNIGCITLMLMLVFWPNLAKRIIMWGMRVLQKLHFMKKDSIREKKLIDSMDQYHKAAAFFLSHKLVIFNVALISIFQRLVLFFVTYLVYCAFGLTQAGPWLVTMLQATISISVDMLPLPGGMGISESLFLKNFGQIFTSQYLLSGLLLSRGISYYALLLISAFVTMGAHLILTIKEKRANVQR